jgi:hypothetical protein
MRRRAFATAVVVAVAVIVLEPNLPGGRVPSEDAGVFFYAARDLLSGGVPYRDVWDHKPPLVYAIDAVGLLVAGPLGVWLLQLVALAGAALLLMRAMRPWFSVIPAAFGTLALLLASPRLFLEDGTQTSFVELFALPLQAAAFAIVASRPEVRFGRRGAVALGALAGLAVLLKPTLVGTWVAIAIVLIWRERRRALVPLLAMAAGGGAVLALVVVYFAARGALGDLVEQVVRYNLAYSSFTPLAERLSAIPEGLRLVSTSGLAPLALAAAAYALWRRVMPPVVVVALVALPIELLLATSGRAYHYYFLAWLPSMAVLAGYAACETMRALMRERALAAIAIAVVLMTVQPVRLVARLTGIRDDGMARAAAAYVVARTTPDDFVLVWGSDAEVLVLADRRSPTRYIYQYAALATRGYATPAAVDALLADLAARPPRVIVDASASAFVTPPLDRVGFRAWTSPEAQYAWPAETERIIAFVEANYVREGAIPGTSWPAWRRR